MTTTPKYSTQEILGYLASKQRDFRVRIGANGIFRPSYMWDENDLDIDDIVGTVPMMFGRPNLVISRIHTIWLPAKGLKRVNDINVSTTLILHAGDDRDIGDLPVPGFRLAMHDIECILEKE